MSLKFKILNLFPRYNCIIESVPIFKFCYKCSPKLVGSKIFKYVHCEMNLKYPIFSDRDCIFGDLYQNWFMFQCYLVCSIYLRTCELAALPLRPPSAARHIGPGAQKTRHFSQVFTGSTHVGRLIMIYHIEVEHNSLQKPICIEISFYLFGYTVSKMQTAIFKKFQRNN